MLISYSYNFIFIHIYKVAGVSIRDALGEFSHKPERHIVCRILRKFGKEPSYYKLRTFPPHTKAWEAEEALPRKVFNNFFKFTFARNPWDWQVSLYHYMLQQPSHFQHDVITRIKNFDDYIKWRVNEDKHLQKEFVVDKDGNVIVDFIGKIENIEQDFQHICKKLGIESTLLHKNKSFHKDYRSYYNDKTVAMIEEHFKEDIEFFDYTFDDT
jgi:hypothetical protein